MKYLGNAFKLREDAIFLRVGGRVARGGEEEGEGGGE